MTTTKKAAVAILGICSAIGLMSFSPTATNNASYTAKEITQPANNMPAADGSLMLRPIMPAAVVIEVDGKEYVIYYADRTYTLNGGPLPEVGLRMKKAAAAKMNKL